MYGLKIHLLSFLIDPKIAQGSDQIRVSITTVPEESKEVFMMEAQKLSGSHHFFSINISNQTKKILFVFRKKNFIKNDPIIASTIVHADELPSPDNKRNSDVKTIKIYEPIGGQHKNFVDVHNRRVFGQMEIKFTITDPEFSFRNMESIERIHKGYGYSKVKVGSNNYNENQNNTNSTNNSIFYEL